jgi:perosamine synthetase
MLSNMLSFEPEISAAVESALMSVFRSSHWSEGPFTLALEAYYESLYSMYACAYSSGGQAMAAIAKLYKDSVNIAVQSNTYYATIHPWLSDSTKLIVVRTDSETLMPTCSQVEYLIGSYDIDILVVTHIGGYVNPDILQIAQLCQLHNIVLIEDCAHAPFVSLEGKYAGSYGDAAIFSFYPTKPIPAGEGGLLLTKSRDLAFAAKTLRNYGKYRDDDGNILHTTGSLGNARISEYNAAVAYTLSTYHESILLRRRKVASMYDALLPSSIHRYCTSVFSSPSYYKYIVLSEIRGILTSPVYDQANQLHSILRANNIDFADPFSHLDLPLHSCLPVNPSMDEASVNTVIESLVI